MNFHHVDRSNWKREEYFNHYFSVIPCTYSITVKLNITAIKAKKLKLYPTLLYCITTAVNRHEEFRTVMKNGVLGIYEMLNPCYTIFHEETKMFSSIWTEYFDDYEKFCQAYDADVKKFGSAEGLFAKPVTIENIFPVSMLPWTSFEGFNLNLQKGYDFLLPIFTLGRYYEANGQFFLPMSLQVHHAVCDGYHVSCIIEEIQQLIASASK